MKDLEGKRTMRHSCRFVNRLAVFAFCLVIAGCSSGSSPASATLDPNAQPPQGDGDPLPVALEDFEGTEDGIEFLDLDLENASWLFTQTGVEPAPDESLFTVETREGGLVMETDSPLVNIHAHFLLGEDPGAGIIYAGSMRRTGDNSGIGVTFHSAFPDRDAYYRLRSFNYDAFLIAPHGTKITEGRFESDVVPEPDIWYDFVIEFIEFDDRIRIRAKIWEQGTPKPEVWTIDCSDSSDTRISGAAVGLWSMNHGNKSWANLRLNGEALPLPQPHVLELVLSDSTVLVGDSVEVRVWAHSDEGLEDVTRDATITASRPGLVNVVPGNPIVLETLQEGLVELRATFGDVDSKLVPLNVLSLAPPVDPTWVDQVTRHGITWYFDQPRPIGRFVTGDYWVQGPVTVSRVTPTPTSTRNGSVLNPKTGPSSGYDGRVPRFDKTISARFPLLMQPGDSLVSTRSHTTAGPYEDLLPSNVSGSFAYLENAEVLTCVVNPVAETYFRPPFVGEERPMFDSRRLRRDLLPNLAPAAESFSMPRDATKTPCEQFQRYFERPWIVHVRDWIGRQTHPTQNMPNYHRSVYNVIADASLLLLCDYPDKERLLIPFIQVGIDMHYASVGGGADSSLHKWPVIFAGILLESDSLMQNRYRYRTQWMSYFAENKQSAIRSSIVSEGRGWTGARALFRQDPGDAEHEHLHPNEWAAVPGSGIAREAYRRLNTKTWPGASLAARIMNAESLWGDEAFFQYVDRWMTELDSANRTLIEDRWNTNLFISGGSCGSSFVKNMWQSYNSRY